MPQIQLPRGSLYYEDQGEGPPLLLLPGLGRNLRHWNGLDRLLATNFRVISLDFIGTGLSKGKGATTVSELGEEAYALLQALHLERVHVLGLSLGGMVALWLSSEHPQCVASQFILNSSLGGIGQRRLEPEAWKAMLKSAVWKKQWIEKILPVSVGLRVSPARRREIQREWQEIESKIGPPSSWVIFRHFYAATQFQASPAMKKLHIPSYILYGTEDQFVSPTNSLQLAKILPNSQLIAIDGGGHELPLESPQELANLVVNYSK